jgi:DNA-binding FadR family transcriptional regulator
MSERGPRWLWLDRVHAQVREKVLSANASHVAFVLAVRYVNGRCEAWPSQRELAAATGRSEKTIRLALHELEQHDLLEIRHGPPARTFGHVYTLRNPV